MPTQVAIFWWLILKIIEYKNNSKETTNQPNNKNKNAKLYISNSIYSILQKRTHGDSNTHGHSLDVGRAGQIVQ